MKKYLLILLSLLAFTVNAQVQFGNQITVKSLIDSIPSTINITTQDIGSSSASGMNSQSFITGTPTANSTAKFFISGKQSLRVMISGTWTGTLQSEISIDGGTTWMIQGIHQTGTSYTAATFTANAGGNLNVTSCTNFRMRATAAMTGTATVKIVSSMNGGTFYIANAVRVADPTTQSQQLAVSAAGAAKVDGSAVTQPVSGTFWQTTQPISNTALGVGQKDKTGALAVTLSNQDVQDSVVTGQSAQTATVNNILTTTAGSAAIDLISYSSFSIQVVSTASGGTYIFEGSNDNTNFVTAAVFNNTTGSGSLIIAAVTASSGTVVYHGTRAFRYLRLRIATTITGGSIQSFSLLCRTSFAPSVYSIGQTAASLLNATIVGTVANSSASSGAPVRIGGRVAPTTPDLTFAAGDVADVMISSGQQVIEKPFAPAEYDYTFNGVVTNSTTALVFKNAAGATTRNYVTSIVVNSDALATASEIVIKDGAVSSTSVSANVLTSGTHDYKIGDAVVFSGVGSYTGISTATTYYVLTVPSATTYTLSTTPNGSTATITGSGTATSNRILFRSKLQTTSFGPASFVFPTPLRGMPNGTLDFQCVTASVTGSVYYNISGYIGF